jgi:hypothetical protein
MKKRLALLLKLAISTGIVALILTRVDLAAMAKTAGSISLVTVAAAMALSLLQNAICAYRWIWIMRIIDRGMDFWPALQASYVAMCLGQCLPSFVGGDAYRIYWLYQQGHAVAPAVRGVLLDRVSAFLGLILMLAVGIPWVLVRFHDPGALMAVWSVLLSGIGGTVVLFSGDLLPGSWRRFRPLAELATLSATARCVFLSGATGLRVTGVSVVLHSLSALAMFMFAMDMDLPLFLRDCLVLIPMLMLISALPISIAGWGVREGVMVAALSPLGVPTEKALILSILLGLVALFNGLLGALPLAFGNIRLSAVRLPRPAER